MSVLGGKLQRTGAHRNAIPAGDRKNRRNSCRRSQKQRRKRHSLDLYLSIHLHWYDQGTNTHKDGYRQIHLVMTFMRNKLRKPKPSLPEERSKLQVPTRKWMGELHERPSPAGYSLTKINSLCISALQMMLLQSYLYCRYISSSPSPCWRGNLSGKVSKRCRGMDRERMHWTWTLSVAFPIEYLILAFFGGRFGNTSHRFSLAPHLFTLYAACPYSRAKWHN
jgi:hypothetical protein